MDEMILFLKDREIHSIDIGLTSVGSLLGYLVGTGVGLDEGSNDGVYIRLSKQKYMVRCKVRRCHMIMMVCCNSMKHED